MLITGEKGAPHWQAGPPSRRLALPLPVPATTGSENGPGLTLERSATVPAMSAAAAPSPDIPLPSLFSLPPCVRIELRPNRGRCLVADAPLPANTLVLVCAPSALLPARSDRCACCLSPSPPTCCKVCKTSYCDAACQRAAWPDHKHECKLLKAFLTKEGAAKVPASVWIPLFLQARLYRGTHAGAPVVGLPVHCHPLTYPTYEAVRCLQRPNLGGIGPSGEAAGVIALGRTLDLFPAHLSPEHLAEDHNSLQLNNFSPTDETLQPVAFASYPAAALLNHSCRPNVALSYGFLGVEGWPGGAELPPFACAGEAAGGGSHAPPQSPPQQALPAHLRNLMAVRTLRPVAEGEELCHAYVDITMARTDRARDLSTRYGFVCTCSTCEAECAAERAAPPRAAPSSAQAECLARARAMVLRSREIATEPTLKCSLPFLFHAPRVPFFSTTDALPCPQTYPSCFCGYKLFLSAVTQETLRFMDAENANPPGVAVRDWQDTRAVIALETSVLVHGIRMLLALGTPKSDRCVIVFLHLRLSRATIPLRLCCFATNSHGICACSSHVHLLIFLQPRCRPCCKTP